MSTAISTAETEQELIFSARQAISSCNWTVGECAARWTERYAKGRTDADFGQLIGLSGDQIYQRRRVWESFADVADDYSELKWSHFYVSVTWSDSSECLAWAQENKATVAEMKAWRRMQRGEDLTIDAEADLSFDQEAAEPGYGEPLLERVPEPPYGESDGIRSTSDSLEESQASANRIGVVAGGAETDSNANYAPFRSDAGSVPRSSDGEDHSPRGLSPEQAVKRVTAAIERSDRLLTEIVIDSFQDLPEKTRLRFLTAMENLNDRISGLS
ncbi:MAG: hypothetical protein O2820_09785 [Planctomycetota bacterium]|nr:hypothetical protein [Planctomycetota bacterium]MDA1249504.1 hypothetical protein [Planctomycetota bacterium]